MDGIEEKLGSILNDPQMMQQIMTMAQALGQSSGEKQEQTPKNEIAPAFDPAVLQKLSGFAGKSSIDPEQKALLKALRPYLSGERIVKLEKAMRAAKMAKIASVFLNSGGLQLLSGR